MLLFLINSGDLVELAAINFTADPAATHHILAHPPQNTWILIKQFRYQGNVFGHMLRV
jgi:hypothetical protein